MLAGAGAAAAAGGLAMAFPDTMSNIFDTITSPFKNVISGVGGIFSKIGGIIKTIIPVLVIGFILFILFKLGIPKMLFGIFKKKIQSPSCFISG